jgi:hypothetical protein
MSMRFLLVLLLLPLLAACGSVQRRITVRSQPAGATVYIDDQEVGETPVSTYFTYYGTRKIQLVKDGYETLTVKQRFRPPWYQAPPLDFISENLTTTELRDERILEFELEPQRLVPPEELLDRAQQLRQSTRAGYTIGPPPPTTIVPDNSATSAGIGATEPSDTGRSADPRVPPPFYP